MAECPATTSRAKKKKPGRKRRVAGWSLLVIGVLIAGVWGASRWWEFGYVTPGFILQCSAGQVRHSDARGGLGTPGWRLKRSLEPNYFDWWLENQSSPVDVLYVNMGIVSYTKWRYSQHVSLLLWPFAFASLLGGGWLVWWERGARRRAMTGVCLKCGYDLSGLGAGSLCPECGKQPIAG